PQEPGREAAFARRIDPAQEPGLSSEQRRLMAQVESAQRYRAAVAPAVSLNHSPDGYTFYSVSQERFLDELEQEAEAARARA
ncbi:COA3 factor, partial [Hemiprocne comata]|nr:COA3 factor [Hemiprocne comata]